MKLKIGRSYVTNGAKQKIVEPIKGNPNENNKVTVV